jgi:hypothetical protein
MQATLTLSLTVSSSTATLLNFVDILSDNGVENMVNSLKTKFSAAYAKKFWSTYNVAGQKAGQYKQVGTFSYLRVYGAGHEVPAYGNGWLFTLPSCFPRLTHI